MPKLAAWTAGTSVITGRADPTVTHYILSAGYVARAMVVAAAIIA